MAEPGAFPGLSCNRKAGRRLRYGFYADHRSLARLSRYDAPPSSNISIHYLDRVQLQSRLSHDARRRDTAHPPAGDRHGTPQIVAMESVQRREPNPVCRLSHHVELQFHPSPVRTRLILVVSTTLTPASLFYVFHLMECDTFYDSHPPYLGSGDRCSRDEITAGTATQFSILGMSTSLCGMSLNSVIYVITIDEGSHTLVQEHLISS